VTTSFIIVSISLNNMPHRQAKLVTCHVIYDGIEELSFIGMKSVVLSYQDYATGMKPY
jgi:hypothetical protein